MYWSAAARSLKTSAASGESAMEAAIRATTSWRSPSTDDGSCCELPIASRAVSSAEATRAAVSARTGSGISSMGSMPSDSGSSTQIACSP